VLTVASSNRACTSALIEQLRSVAPLRRVIHLAVDWLAHLPALLPQELAPFRLSDGCPGV
jgi:hypothetical protein